MYPVKLTKALHGGKLNFEKCRWKENKAERKEKKGDFTFQLKIPNLKWEREWTSNLEQQKLWVGWRAGTSEIWCWEKGNKKEWREYGKERKFDNLYRCCNPRLQSQSSQNRSCHWRSQSTWWKGNNYIINELRMKEKKDWTQDRKTEEKKKGWKRKKKKEKKKNTLITNRSIKSRWAKTNCLICIIHASCSILAWWWSAFIKICWW